MYSNQSENFDPFSIPMIIDIDNSLHNHHNKSLKNSNKVGSTVNHHIQISPSSSCTSSSSFSISPNSKQTLQEQSLHSNSFLSFYQNQHRYHPINAPYGSHQNSPSQKSHSYNSKLSNNNLHYNKTKHNLSLFQKMHNNENELGSTQEFGTVSHSPMVSLRERQISKSVPLIYSGGTFVAELREDDDDSILDSEPVISDNENEFEMNKNEILSKSSEEDKKGLNSQKQQKIANQSERSKTISIHKNKDNSDEVCLDSSGNSGKMSGSPYVQYKQVSFDELPNVNHVQMKVLSKLDKWCDLERFGEPLEGTQIIPLKTPIHNIYLQGGNWNSFTLNSFVEDNIAQGYTVGLIVDLSNHDCIYDVDTVKTLSRETIEYVESCSGEDEVEKRRTMLKNAPRNTSVEYAKVKCISKQIPPVCVVDEFCKVLDEFFEENPKHYAGVHCSYGYNRTGFMTCSYLVQSCGMKVREALSRFEKARFPGVKHKHFRRALYKRYEPENLKEFEALERRRNSQSEGNGEGVRLRSRSESNCSSGSGVESGLTRLLKSDIK